MQTPDFDAVEDVLECPGCGTSSTHVDDVVMLSREVEDGPLRFTHLNAGGTVIALGDADGHVRISSTWTSHSVPVYQLAPDGRRHSIAMVGTCEGHDCLFVIEHRQHKGETLVASRVLRGAKGKTVANVGAGWDPDERAWVYGPKR